MKTLPNREANPSRPEREKSSRALNAQREAPSRSIRPKGEPLSPLSVAPRLGEAAGSSRRRRVQRSLRCWRGHRTFATVAAALLILLCSGHVGSPDTWFAGDAGPYPVTVVVRAPGAVPGLADVTIRVEGEGVRRVTAAPAQATAQAGAAPPPDVATPVAGDPELYSVQLWLMTDGAYRIDVTVEGSRGSGTASVPVTAVATEILGIDRPLGIVLAGIGLFLAVGLLTIVGAAVRESVLPPGEEPDRKHRRRARLAMGGTGLLLALLLLGGWNWWQAEEAAIARFLNWTLASGASVQSAGDDRVLTLAITDSAWLMRNDPVWLRRNQRAAMAPLIPDHGKLMHMFLVRTDKDAFAHLHPVPRDSSEFVVTLPPLPAGRYRVYGDIVRENGMTHTLVSEVDLPPPSAAPGGPAAGAAIPIGGGTASAPDADDSWWASRTAGNLDGAAAVRLSDGSTMTWERAPGALVADQEAGLRFSVRAPDGSPAALEPYMGMAGHAMVTRSDDSVFVHLHPTGSIAMAAQKVIEMSEAGDTARGMLGERITRSEMSGMAHGASEMPQTSTVRFPYAFPQPGNYRVWVQVKRGGKILTGAFDAEVRGG